MHACKGGRGGGWCVCGYGEFENGCACVSVFVIQVIERIFA